MLLRFRVENHRSLRDPQELTLVASAARDHPENVARLDGIGDVLRAAAIYGANASGKTNVWDAMMFMGYAVSHSQRTWNPHGGIPRRPFLLDKTHASSPTMLEVDLALEDTRYQYGFVLDSERILSEWLYWYPNDRRAALYSRETDSIRIGKGLAHARAFEPFMRPNSLFLSAANQNNAKPPLSQVYHWFETVRFASPDLSPGCQLVTQQLLAGRPEEIFSLLRAADLGIVALETKPHKPEKLEQDLGRSVMAVLREHFQWPEDTAAERPPDVYLRHGTRSQRGGVSLPLTEESRGTKALFGLAGPVLHALTDGSTLFVDELDASLHPTLCLALLRLFCTPQLNPRNAQLIFNTHDTNLLSPGLLRRDQIWFTEKDEDGATHLYPLSDYHPRKHENVERGYLQGRYGAIPFIGSMDFLERLASEDAQAATG